MNELKEIRLKALANAIEVISKNKEMITECYEVVSGLLNKAKHEGLLALESEAGFIPPDMMLSDYITRTIEMICDGTDADYLSELMTVRFMANNYTGIEAVIYYLYSRSLLMIQAGMNIIEVEEFFNSVTSGSVLKFDTRHKICDERRKKEINNWKDMLLDVEKEALNEVSSILRKLSEQEWKMVVSSNGFSSFDTVFLYLDDDIQLLCRNYINECRLYLINLWAKRVKEHEWFEIVEELKRLIVDLGVI